MVLQLTMPLGMSAYRQAVRVLSQRKNSKQSAAAGVHGCSDGVRRHVVLSRVISIRRNQILSSFLSSFSKKFSWMKTARHYFSCHGTGLARSFCWREIGNDVIDVP